MSARPEGAPYRIRIDEMRLNGAINIIEFHDADADKWVVIGWYEGFIRDCAFKNGNTIHDEIARWNEEFQDGDPHGLGYLHHL